MSVKRPRKGSFVVRDGLRMRVGGPLFRFWLRHRRSIHGQPPLPHPPAHTDLERQKQIVAYCHQALTFRGRMHYTMSAARSILFHRRPGDFAGAYADCSQFVSAILHWVGVAVVNQYDDTRTLLEKGTVVKTAAPARVVIFGPAGGAHGGFVTEKAPNGDWWVVGFGSGTGPDRVLLSVLKTYFAARGEPGVRFLDFLN